MPGSFHFVDLLVAFDVSLHFFNFCLLADLISGELGDPVSQGFFLSDPEARFFLDVD